ncbi:MAG: right-handed parallel beta-helix repeat-containing protein [Anaerolineales bacterium]|nr:right-handed parallel beta-helix repeat-containing protein [Anaerolineales bacterium]
MPRLPMIGSDAAQWGALLNDFLRVAHREDGAPRGQGLALDVRDFGVVGDGATDDTAALAACLQQAGQLGQTAFLRAGLNVRVTGNLFLYGHASLVGENPDDCTITLDGDLEASGAGMSAYWFNCGIPSKGGTPATWTGRITGVQFRITLAGLGTAPYLHLLQFHKAAHFELKNCRFDLTPVGHAPVAALVSQLDGNWCASPGTTHGRIEDNLFLGASHGSPATGGSGGINLVGLDGGLIAGNVIEGFADDAIALINCRRCVVRDNWVKGVRSRIAAFSGNDITFLSNRLERQPGADNAWVLDTDFYTAHPAGPASAAPENIKFIGNTAVLPGAAPSGGWHNFLDLGGVRNCVASGNLFINDSNQVNPPRLLTWVFTAFPGWTDPTGNDPPGKARPYRVVLTNNLLTGQYPGRIEEAAVLAADLVGPIVYQGNLAGGFNVFGSNSFWEDSNKLL